MFFSRSEEVDVAGLPLADPLLRLRSPVKVDAELLKSRNLRLIFPLLRQTQDPPKIIYTKPST